jgi:hypothetical protein
MLGPPLPPSSSPRRRAAPTPATPGRAPDTTSARDRQEHAQHATRMHRQHGEPLRSSASPLFYFLLPPSHGRGGSQRRRHATAPQGGGRGTRRSSERHGAASSLSLLAWCASPCCWCAALRRGAARRCGAPCTQRPSQQIRPRRARHATCDSIFEGLPSLAFSGVENPTVITASPNSRYLLTRSSRGRRFTRFSPFIAISTTRHTTAESSPPSDSSVHGVSRLKCFGLYISDRSR